MKILFATDFHLDARPAGYDLFDDIVAAMGVITIESGNADLLVLGGDQTETARPSPRAYAALLNLLNAVPCPVVVLQGNHDVGTLAPLATIRAVSIGEMESTVFDLHPGDGISTEAKVLTVTEPCVVGFKGKLLLFAPYMPQSASDRLLPDVYRDAFERGRAEHVVAAFCHLDVCGAHGPGGFELLAGPAAIPAEARKLDVPILNGHIHLPQTVGNVVMPGSLVPTAFGEGGQRRVAIVEV